MFIKFLIEEKMLTGGWLTIYEEKCFAAFADFKRRKVKKIYADYLQDGHHRIIEQKMWGDYESVEI